MSWKVKVRIDGEVREIEVTQMIVEGDAVIHLEPPGRMSLGSFVQSRPDWSLSLIHI